MTDSLRRGFAPYLDYETARFRRFLVMAGLISSSLIQAGCATTAPAVRTEIVTVDRPIPVACVKAADIPAEPATIGKLPDDARAALDLTAAKNIEVRLWGRSLAAMLIACSEVDR